VKAKHLTVPSTRKDPRWDRSSRSDGSWRQAIKSPIAGEEGGRQDKVLSIPQVPRARDWRLHPPEGWNRTPHRTKTTQAVRQEPRVEKKDHWAHHRWHRSGQDSRYVRRAVGQFPWQRGNHALLMHLGTVPLCQRHHWRNAEHFHGKHEKKSWRAHECQLAGPVRLQHRRKTTFGILRLRTSWWGFKFSHSFARASIDGQHICPSSPDWHMGIMRHHVHQPVQNSSTNEEKPFSLRWKWTIWLQRFVYITLGLRSVVGHLLRGGGQENNNGPISGDRLSFSL